ncbi:MAG: alkaline phosphatase family protein [Planctomycetes bacterium]|nr:alkaline phosphatase family protein [Planctomycetota bacterium]MCB9903694.1 alkaline phosphatase family protein [Planctomycetota bacterium]
MRVNGLVLAACAGVWALGVGAQEPAGPEAARPRLVVMIAVDQMIPEQLERLRSHFTGGFARFANQGRVHRRALLGYSRTETGPGHASYGTGCWPRTHGIVANDFRDAERGGWTYCAGDEDARPITRLGLEADSKHYRVSPRNLLVDGAAAWFERSWSGAKTVSISGKDRASILMAGRGADTAVWWDKYRCGFTTSDHYGDALPAWAAEWNLGWRERCDGYVWEPLVPLDELVGTGTEADDREGEASCSSNGRVFPHPAPPLSDEPNGKQIEQLGHYVYISPLVDAHTLELARRAVVAEDLGGDEQVDLLCISLTACDTVGHLTGPYSAETTDVLLRADRELGCLFDLLDERLGPDGWIASLSADHGVLELPEARRARLEPGGRLVAKQIKAAREGMRAALNERFGTHFRAALGGGGAYLDPTELAGHDAAAVRAFARDYLLREVDWIAGAFTSDELLAADRRDGDPFFELARNSTTPTRGPDVAIRVVPWTLIDRATGTTHGTPYPYDRRVPLVFLGPGFEAGTIWEPADSADALPTILHALGVEFDAAAFDGVAR